MKITLTLNNILGLAFAKLRNDGFAITESNGVGENVLDVIGDRFARNSSGGNYICKHEWPLDCAVQCGGHGIVIEPGGPSIDEAVLDQETAEKIIKHEVPHRKTAFFEAFPKEPRTFVRGEGKTVEEAEQRCWELYQKIIACPSHELERRGRKDGYCYCKHCGLSGMFMDPSEACAGCGATKYEVWGEDKDGKPYCKTCHKKLPHEMLSDSSRRVREMTARLGR